jgi:hypothetical protein
MWVAHSAESNRDRLRNSIDVSETSEDRISIVMNRPTICMTYRIVQHAPWLVNMILVS